MSDVMTYYRQLPLVSRTVATAIALTSLGRFFNIVPNAWLFFNPRFIFRMPPQLWRIVTNFLVTRNFIFEPYLVYSSMSQLESIRFSRRDDLIWYLSCVSIATIIIDQVLGFHHAYYLQGLILALAYTNSQDQRGVTTSFLFLTLPAQLMPYAIMLFSLIADGLDTVFLQFCGLLAAHLFDFLTRIWPEFGGGPNLLPTPAFLTRLVGGAEAPTPAPVASARDATTGGSGPLPDSWKARGGHRLGGD